jgi:hypothetical protein
MLDMIGPEPAAFARAPAWLVAGRPVGPAIRSVVVPLPPSLSAPALVTCILPTYDRRARLPGAVAGVLAQDYSALELLVLDDGPAPAAVQRLLAAWGHVPDAAPMLPPEGRPDARAPQAV